VDVGVAVSVTVSVSVSVSVTVTVTVTVAVTVSVTVCVTVGVVGVGVGVGVSVGVAVSLVLGVGEALTVGEADGVGVVADGLGDVVVAWTGWQDSLPACVATGGAATAVTAAVALPAARASRLQEPAASRTLVADRATAVRRVRVNRIENTLASSSQYHREMKLSV
jgi:hypothetical protein